jgi:hypothetical protein
MIVINHYPIQSNETQSPNKIQNHENEITELPNPFHIDGKVVSFRAAKGKLGPINTIPS